MDNEELSRLYINLRDAHRSRDPKLFSEATDKLYEYYWNLHRKETNSRKRETLYGHIVRVLEECFVYYYEIMDDRTSGGESQNQLNSSEETA